MKFPQLYRIVCEKNFREELRYAVVKKDFTYATDSHVLVRHETSKLFDDVFISKIPAEGVALNHHILKALCLRSVIRAELFRVEIVLHTKDKSKNPQMCFDLPRIEFLKFPDFNKVLWNETDAKPLKQIIINPVLLHKACLAIDPELTYLKMYFQSEERSILIKPKLDSDYFGAVGVIMPCAWE